MGVDWALVIRGTGWVLAAVFVAMCAVLLEGAAGLALGGITAWLSLDQPLPPVSAVADLAGYVLVRTVGFVLAILIVRQSWHLLGRALSGRTPPGPAD